jgi:hypothetical protein
MFWLVEAARYHVGGPPCRWLCALPKGLYLQQMGWQMTFLQTLAPNCLCKYVLFRQGGRVEPQSCIWPHIVGGGTGLVHYQNKANLHAKTFSKTAPILWLTVSSLMGPKINTG